MSFIRPEVQDLLWRWREVVVGGAAITIGALMGFRGLGIVPYVGIAVCLAGVGLIWTGVQRVRFRQTVQGPGTIDLDEGRVTYFGPLTGGSLALEDVRAIMLDATGHPKHWMLLTSRDDSLVIPVTADGADQLFDAFATLPGFSANAMLTALNDTVADKRVIWQRRAD